MNDPIVVERGDAPLILSMPHAGTDLTDELASRFVSPWLARKDTDWWIDRLYGFAGAIGATLVRTSISRSVIDVNRDPSGASLYPGLATTGLCPTTTFDGEPLYRPGREPDALEIAARRERWFDPYHLALEREIERLHSAHRKVVVYDCHAIRSRIPRLFDGRLPRFSIGTGGGRTCDPALAAGVLVICASSGGSVVRDGRFRGGWTTRRYGEPSRGVHAIQMELAFRAYIDEPDEEPSIRNWPSGYDAPTAAPLQAMLGRVFDHCLAFARERS